jgi:hypothetical protein
MTLCHCEAQRERSEAQSNDATTLALAFPPGQVSHPRGGGECSAPYGRSQ